MKRFFLKFISIFCIFIFFFFSSSSIFTKKVKATPAVPIILYEIALDILVSLGLAEGCNEFQKVDMTDKVANYLFNDYPSIIDNITEGKEGASVVEYGKIMSENPDLLADIISLCQSLGGTEYVEKYDAIPMEIGDSYSFGTPYLLDGESFKTASLVNNYSNSITVRVSLTNICGKSVYGDVWEGAYSNYDISVPAGATLDLTFNCESFKNSLSKSLLAVVTTLDGFVNTTNILDGVLSASYDLAINADSSICADLELTKEACESVCFYPDVVAEDVKSVDNFVGSYAGSVSYPNSLGIPVADGVTFPWTATDYGYEDASDVIGALQDVTGTTTWDDTAQAVKESATDLTNEKENSSEIDLTLPSSLPIDFSPLMQSVGTKFPFCIPFDFVNLFRNFTAERKAPVWHVDFSAGKHLVGEGSFDIDFSKFEKLAQIFRLFILISFVFALVSKTNKFIDRG